VSAGTPPGAIGAGTPATHRVTGRLVIAALGLAASLRALWLLFPSLDSDQAVIGLMARHVLEGAFPVFYWSEATSGAIEVLVTAALFFVGGASRVTLNLAPAALSVVFVWAVSRLAGDVFGRGAGWVAVALAACPPVLLVWNSVLARGNYVSNLLLGTLGLLLAHRLAEADPGTPRGQRLALVAGAVGGLAWYTSFQSVHYLAAGAAYVTFRQRRRLVRALPLAVLAFLVGSAPFWLDNLRTGFASVAHIRRQMGHTMPGHDLAALMHHLAVMAGAAEFRDTPERLRFPPVPVLGGIGGLLLAGSVALGASAGLRRRRPGIGLLLLVGSINLLVLTLGGITLTEDARYLLPLYSAGIPLAAGGLAAATQWWRPAGLGALALVIAANLGGQARGWTREAARFPRYAAEDTQLLDWLRTQGVAGAFAPDYWLSYRLTFDAAEQIIVATPFWDEHPRTESKRPEYTYRVRATAPPTYVLWTRAERFAETLQAAQIPYVTTRLGRYTILHGFRPPAEAPGLPAGSWRGDQALADRAFDRDPWTAWHGTEFTLDLGATQTVTQVALHFGHGPPPAGLHLEGAHRSHWWMTLSTLPRFVPGFAWTGRTLLLEEHGRVALAVPAAPIRYLRVRPLRGDAPWSLNEVFVFGGPGPSRSDAEDGIHLEERRAWGAALRHHAVRLLDAPDDETALLRLPMVATELGLHSLAAVYDALAARTLGAAPEEARRFAARAHAVAPQYEVTWSRLAETLRATGRVAEADVLDTARRRYFTPDHALDVRFGAHVRLHGADVDPGPVAPGSVVRLRSYWHLTLPIPPGLRVEVELRDAERLRHPLAERWFLPMPEDAAAVRSAVQVREDIALRIPCELPAGTYTVRLAVHDPARRERLAIREGWWPARRRVLTVGAIRLEQPRPGP
jgi:hypothetical protein